MKKPKLEMVYDDTSPQSMVAKPIIAHDEFVCEEDAFCERCGSREKGRMICIVDYRGHWHTCPEHYPFGVFVSMVLNTGQTNDK
mgnify:CR=1 FL=1